MRESGIVEPKVLEDIDIAEKNDSEAEADSDEEDPNILCPRKPSHVEFGKSTIKAKDLDVLKMLEYIGQKDDGAIRFTGDEIIHEPNDNEVVVFMSFFRVGLRFPMHEMIVVVLKNWNIPLLANAKCNRQNQHLYMGPLNSTFKRKY